MRKIINNILSSFDAHTPGYSARKLSAFVGVSIAVIATFKLPTEMLLHAIYAWQIFALLCLGIVTIEQIINLKNNKQNELP